MLFKVTEKNDVFADNPELESIDAFRSCTSRQLKYVFYAYDYKSPLRQMPLQERLEKAARLAGYKTEKDRPILDKNGRSVVAGGVPRVNAAVRAFKEVQYDQDKETLLGIEEQMRQITELANKKDKEPKELELSVKISQNLTQLAKVKKELIEILDMRDEVVATVEEDTIQEAQLSTLDLLNMEDE